MMMSPDFHTVLDASLSGAATPPVPLVPDPSAIQDGGFALRPIEKIPLAPPYAKLPVRAVSL